MEERHRDKPFKPARAPFLLSFTVGFLLTAASLPGQIFFIDSFNPSEIGQLNGIGFDPVSGNLFIHASANASIHVYTPTGTLVDTITDPGDNGNDSDYEFAFQAININGVNIPANSLLIIEADNLPARLIAADKNTGATLATLSLGSVRLTGGSFHPARATFFTIDFTADVIREIDPANGSQLNSFGFGGGWDAFFSDVEVLGADNNLYLVSSTQNIIRVLGETGTFIQDIDVGALGVTGMSGIAFDDLSGEAWISSTNGNVYHLGGFEAIPEPSTAAFIALGIICLFLGRRLSSSRD